MMEQKKESMQWKVVYTKAAKADVSKLQAAHLAEKAKNLIAVLKQNPYQTPPTYEKLVGDFKGAYSRRINAKHRLVYQVFEEERAVKILSMWSHYEK